MRIPMVFGSFWFSRCFRAGPNGNSNSAPADCSGSCNQDKTDRGARRQNNPIARRHGPRCSAWHQLKMKYSLYFSLLAGNSGLAPPVRFRGDYVRRIRSLVGTMWNRNRTGNDPGIKTSLLRRLRAKDDFDRFEGLSWWPGSGMQHF
jgi:hypothetical protein